MISRSIFLKKYKKFKKVLTNKKLYAIMISTEGKENPEHQKGHTMIKKYSVEYRSGATGFEWKEEYDRLDEFEDFVDEMRGEYTAFVSVFDYSRRKFIFFKKALTYKPEKDMLGALLRDMRTTTGETK